MKGTLIELKNGLFSVEIEGVVYRMSDGDREAYYPKADRFGRAPRTATTKRKDIIAAVQSVIDKTHIQQRIDQMKNKLGYKFRDETVKAALEMADDPMTSGLPAREIVELAILQNERCY